MRTNRTQMQTQTQERRTTQQQARPNLRAAIVESWTFTSDSRAGVEYETLRLVGGALTCNCPGWTRRVDASGSRTCKHTRAVQMGRTAIAVGHVVFLVEHQTQNAGSVIAPRNATPFGGITRRLVTE